MSRKQITEWKQERPFWCPHPECEFARRVMDNICGGNLSNPEPHDGDFNTHRVCLNDVLDHGEVFDLQVNNADLWWLRWVFDALDGKSTATSTTTR